MAVVAFRHITIYIKTALPCSMVRKGVTSITFKKDETNHVLKHDNCLPMCLRSVIIYDIS